jgi:hypothetical protein
MSLAVSDDYNGSNKTIVEINTEQKFKSTVLGKNVLEHTLTAEDFNKVWHVVLEVNGKTYSRVITFNTDTKIFPYGTGKMPENLGNLFPEQEHPQYKDRNNTGVCFSGGGSRALIMAMGQMRFLHQYREQIKYMSSVSGGSWATAIYSYGNKGTDINDLLGAPSSPSALDPTITEVPQMALGAVGGYKNKSTDQRGMTVPLIFNLIKGLAYSVEKSENLDGNRSKLDQESQDVVAKVEELISTIKEILGEVPTPLLAPFDRLWIDSVGMTFFGKNNIYNYLATNRDYFTLDETAEEQMKQGSGSFKLKLMQPFTEIRKVKQYDGVYPPYPIMNSLMLRPTNNITDSDYVGYEYTPLYHGAAHNSQVKGVGPFIGGGNTLMATYGASSNQKIEDNIATIFSQSNNYAPSLAVTSGISSSAFAGFTSSSNNIMAYQNIIELIKKFFNNQADIDNLYNQMLNEIKTTLTPPSGLQLTKEQQINQQKILDFFIEWIKGFFILLFKISEKINFDKLTPKANYFNVSENTIPENTEFNFGDAGLADNFGLMALLRREVKNIIIFVNTGVPLKEGYKYDKQQELVTDEMDTSVAAFFGLSSDVSRGIGGIDHNNLQIFDENNFSDLVNQFQNTRTSGMMATTNFPIKENDFWGVPASNDTTILWVYNHLSDHWAKSAGDGIVDELKQEVPNFPFLDTTDSSVFGSSPFVINALSNLSYNVLEENQSKIKSILNN